MNRVGETIGRRLLAGSVAALTAVLLTVPVAGAQSQESADSHDATAANGANATASSQAEISSGDIVTGHNSGNEISTADTHEGNITISGGNFASPTNIDFYIDSGYNDAWADGGYSEAGSTGPEQSIDVDKSR